MKITLSIFTTMMLRQRFYCPDQPKNHKKEKEKGKEANGGEKKISNTLIYTADFSTVHSLVFKNPAKYILI